MKRDGCDNETQVVLTKEVIFREGKLALSSVLHSHDETVIFVNLNSVSGCSCQISP
jgi:hypothetical protein